MLLLNIIIIGGISRVCFSIKHWPKLPKLFKLQSGDRRLGKCELRVPTTAAASMIASALLQCKGIKVNEGKKGKIEGVIFNYLSLSLFSSKLLAQKQKVMRRIKRKTGRGGGETRKHKLAESEQRRLAAIGEPGEKWEEDLSKTGDCQTATDSDWFKRLTKNEDKRFPVRSGRGEILSE